MNSDSVVDRLFNLSQISLEGNSIMQRRFEYVGGSSAKFWEVTQVLTEVNVRYGRMGTNGQQQTKSFDDTAAANRHADKLIGEKLRNGYVECVAS